jgi:hypothetical protein
MQRQRRRSVAVKSQQRAAARHQKAVLVRAMQRAPQQQRNLDWKATGGDEDSAATKPAALGADTAEKAKAAAKELSTEPGGLASVTVKALRANSPEKKKVVSSSASGVGQAVQAAAQQTPNAWSGIDTARFAKIGRKRRVEHISTRRAVSCPRRSPIRSARKGVSNAPLCWRTAQI